VKPVPDKCPFCESPIMVHGGNLLRSEDGGFATYECKSSRDVQWSDPQWSRSGQTEVCRIREIMLLGRQLSVANKCIKRMEREIEVLRFYGNRGCTAMADEALAKEAKL
jgi:hypothetical protein